MQQVSNAITLRIEDIFHDMGIAKRKFNEFFDEMKPWNNYISSQWKSEIIRRRAELAGTELKTQRELGNLLQKLRGNTAEESEMERLLDSFDSDNICSSMSIDTYLKEHRYIEMKIEILKQFKPKNNLLTRFTSIKDIFVE